MRNNASIVLDVTCDGAVHLEHGTNATDKEETSAPKVVTSVTIDRRFFQLVLSLAFKPLAEGLHVCAYESGCEYALAGWELTLLLFLGASAAVIYTVYNNIRTRSRTRHDLRDVGITYGGGGLCAVPRLAGGISAAFEMEDGAPAELEATADSTWSGDNVYALLLTLYGGAVAHTAKLLHLIVDSSTESEAVATAKAGEIVTYARTIMRGLGIQPAGPTFVGSDNKANTLLASGRSLPTRLRHCLRRYQAFVQRVRGGECEIGHVRDEANPSDFMTKFVPKAKFEASHEYATNAKNAVRG